VGVGALQAVVDLGTVGAGAHARVYLAVGGGVVYRYEYHVTISDKTHLISIWQPSLT